MDTVPIRPKRAHSDRLWFDSNVATRISENQRKLLKEKTGFEGYTAFLEDYNRKDSVCEELLKTWRFAYETPPRATDKHPHELESDILDLIKDENSSIRSSLCCRTASNSKLFTALCEPREGLYGRIVFWHIPRSRFSRTDFLEDLGLVLNMEPRFVRSLYTKSYPDVFDFTHMPIFVANHTMVGERVATMTRCCIGERSSAVPIVLIADTTDAAFRDYPRGSIEHELQSTRRSGVHFYSEMIMGIIGRNTDFSTNADDLIFPALLAVMHMDAYNLRILCDYTPRKGRTDGNGHSLEARSKYANVLRRRLEDFEDLVQDALAGLSSLYGARWSKSDKCRGSVEYFTHTINRARRFEANIRDTCQVKIGQLSLDESRKSTELSISQAEEGQRGELRVHCNINLSLTHHSQDM